MTFAFPKPSPHRDARYLAFIRNHPCCACEAINEGQKTRTECAHTGRHALGSKADDYRAIPLCEKHHRSDSHGLDKRGRWWFEESYGLVIDDVVMDLLIERIAGGNYA